MRGYCDAGQDWHPSRGRPVGRPGSDAQVGGEAGEGRPRPSGLPQPEGDVEQATTVREAIYHLASARRLGEEYDGSDW